MLMSNEFPDDEPRFSITNLLLYLFFFRYLFNNSLKVKLPKNDITRLVTYKTRTQIFQTFAERTNKDSLSFFICEETEIQKYT